jgi:guanine deaminase
MHDSGTAIAHCPTSNMFLGSGLFDVRKAKQPDRTVRVGLATDVGAGTTLSMLRTMGSAYQVAQLGGGSLSAPQAFYLATRGAARALYLEDKIGSIAVGMEADLIVLNMRSTPLLDFRMEHCQTLEEALFVLMTSGSEHVVRTSILSGKTTYLDFSG